MSYSNPANLGIVSCPGGDVFAGQLIFHLKTEYGRVFEKTSADMAKRYGLPEGEVARQINFINEITSSGACPRSKDLQLHVPRFRVKTRWSMFSNGEIKSEILESIRGRDLYIVQDVENRHPVKFTDKEGSVVTKRLTVNDHLTSIFVMVDAARRSGAGRITLVLPVYPYSRQHKAQGREALTASRIGMIFERLGVNRIITLDIHSREIGNGFSILSFENLHASYQIIEALAKVILLSEDFVVVAPDTGAVDRNKFYAVALKKPLAMIYKERDYSKISKTASDSNIKDIKLLGDVRGKTVFMADDMLDTGGTLLNAMKFLKEKGGADKIICAVSLPLFSGGALEIFDEAYKQGLFYRIIGTNAVHHEKLPKREWYYKVNITKLFAQTISHLHQGLSLSSILDNRDKIINTLLAKANATRD
ncbi:MAG: ribose-phosphate diphosphokinase [Spirochaetaceae bacterium]|jgi:ribose-phosphate pyrophosphokinase|nr:ribose-phosphate diphosphokinase [Spirochaetaceae bacterium]